MDEEILAEVKNDICRQFGYNSFDDLLKDNVLKRSPVIAVALDRTINAIVREYVEKSSLQNKNSETNNSK